MLLKANLRNFLFHFVIATLNSTWVTYFTIKLYKCQYRKQNKEIPFQCNNIYSNKCIY